MKSNPTVSLQTITPEIAAELLKRNEGNRRLSDKNVFFLYKQMNEWRHKIKR